MDTVFIRGLVVDAFVGVYDSEKLARQPLVFDIEMAWDIAKAGKTDSLEYTLDYDAVRKRIERFAEENQLGLVETFAEELSAMIMKEFSVPGLRMRVAKPEAIANTIDVGVCISRGLSF